MVYVWYVRLIRNPTYHLVESIQELHLCSSRPNPFVDKTTVPDAACRSQEKGVNSIFHQDQKANRHTWASKGTLRLTKYGLRYVMNTEALEGFQTGRELGDWVFTSALTLPYPPLRWIGFSLSSFETFVLQLVANYPALSYDVDSSKLKAIGNNAVSTAWSSLTKVGIVTVIKCYFL